MRFQVVSCCLHIHLLSTISVRQLKLWKMVTYHHWTGSKVQDYNTHWNVKAGEDGEKAKGVPEKWLNPLVMPWYWSNRDNNLPWHLTWSAFIVRCKSLHTLTTFIVFAFGHVKDNSVAYNLQQQKGIYLVLFFNFWLCFCYPVCWCVTVQLSFLRKEIDCCLFCSLHLLCPFTL